MILEVGEYKVNVVRSSRAKRMLLRVLSPYGEIKLTLPKKGTLLQAKNFVLKHSAWIECQRNKVVKPITEISYLDGGTAFKLFGVLHTVIEVSGEQYSITLDDQICYFSAPITATKNERMKFLKEYMTERAKEEFLPRVKEWEEKIGVQSTGVSFRFMTSRWGSCNTRSRHINFNVLAVQNSPEYMDYLTCHELLHIIYPNHGTKFQNHLNKLIPNAKQYRRWSIK